ncbi:DUF2280 domain-containing protein [Superficieibacter sp. HKU1]|uniref:DUF2280 domain-containing protein n=1 Tax=Superficieibacter sp. HKU1 TaxID=3031919 RepID=UPI0023E0C0BD|nr:DUF2280 domain-containing protein [Superficieibacter sp. HKU1]WES69668.1 DUF2280 domain-containing protein [Superficieibacter sp. HKU1]
MAALSPEVKAFIVQALACFDTPTQISAQVKQEFGLSVTIQQVSSYDPTKAIAKNLGQKWVDLFHETRKRFQTELSDIPIATKAKVSKSVTSDGYQSDVVTDAQIVEKASDEAAAVVLAHREGLAAWRGITNKLRDFLEDAEITEDNHASISRSITAGVDAQIKVINAERKAYNLDTEEGNKTVDDLSSMMDDLAKG